MHKTIPFLLALAIAISSNAAPTEITIIVSGGYTSCGSSSPKAHGIGMYANFKKLAQTLKGRAKLNYLITCFESSPPPNGRMPYVTSDDIRNEDTADTGELRKLIETKYGTRTDNAIFLVGHSYGGWLAMHLAQTLKVNRPIDGLFSIDPIGPRCGPAEVIFGDSNCRSAPKDLDNKAIKSRVNTWLNFYQTQDAWLHSSAIAEAKNFRMTYYGPHTQVDSDNRTWAEITNAINLITK